MREEDESNLRWGQADTEDSFKPSDASTDSLVLDARTNRPEPQPLVQVIPVLDSRVRSLCINPYEGHKKGCPNFGDAKHSHRCPPGAPLFDNHFDLARPVYAVVNEFDLAAHMAKMARNNPTWTDRQLRCVLYWQGTARKQLKEKIVKGLSLCPAGYDVTWCPEGMGVNVTATLEAVGIILEWPPKKIVRQVALLAARK